MKQLILATFIILAASAAYAGSTFLLLHVGSPDGGSGGACSGIIDGSNGCPLPMLGI